MIMHQRFLVLIVVIAVAASAFVFWDYYDKNRIFANKFVGQIKEVQDNILILEGSYVAEGHLELNSELRRVKAVVGPETKLVKVSVYMPTKEELELNKGKFYPNLLQREEGEGFLEDLKDGTVNQPVTIKNSFNIYKRKGFIIGRLEYVKLVYQ